MFRQLPVSEILAASDGSRHGLGQVYRRADLIVLGIGVMVGAGIFKLAGEQAGTMSGPGVLLSFILAGLVCLLCAAAYAELSSVLPSAGSAYSFTYVAFGEVWAWIIGWSLLLEMVLAAAAVSRVWSIYLLQALQDLDISVPTGLASHFGVAEGLDLPSAILLGGLVLIVAAAARLGIRVLWTLVLAKLAVIALVILLGFPHVKPTNLTPFVVAPEPTGEIASSDRTVLQLILGGDQHAFGWYGIFVSAAVVAFAYIGFDVLATAAEETARPQTDVAHSMITSVLIATGLYVGVAFVMVGMVPFRRLGSATTPLSDAFDAVGNGFMRNIIDFGAVVGLATVVLVLLIGQARVGYAMARDGLLPKPLARLSPRFHTPSVSALVLGLIAIGLGQFVPVLDLAPLLTIGALFCFVFVSAGVIVLRWTRPELQRGFRMPWVPVLPLLAIAGTGWLMLGLPVEKWAYFGIWTAVGLVVYLLYGRRRSRLNRLLTAEIEQLRSRSLHGRRHTHV